MAKTIERKCKTCRFLKVPPNRAGRRVVRNDAPYLCNFPVPDIAPLPDSLTDSPWFRGLDTIKRKSMVGDEGTSCPTWQPLESLETETTHVWMVTQVESMEAFDLAIAGKTVHVQSSAPTQDTMPTTHKRAREVAAQWIDNPRAIGWPVGVFIETLSRDDCLMLFKVVTP